MFAVVLIFSLLAIVLYTDNSEPFIPESPPSPLTGDYIVQTVENYNIIYAQNEGFKIQDITNNVLDTFTVSSGSLEGIGNLNATTTGGIFLFTPTTSGTLSLTSTNNNFQLTVNGHLLSGNSIDFVADSTYLIRWNYP